MTTFDPHNSENVKLLSAFSGSKCSRAVDSAYTRTQGRLSVCLWEAFVQGKPFLFLVSARLCVEVLVNEPQSSTHNRLQFNKELYPGPQNQLSVLSTEVTIELIGEPCI